MPHRILVVDDEASIRDLLKDHFEAEGFMVVCAEDVDSGIEAFEQYRPHLAVIDFLLRKGNGFAVAEAIRQDPEGASTAILIISGVFKNPRTVAEARDNYNALGFLKKPLDLEDLTSRVTNALADVPEDDFSPEVPGADEPEEVTDPGKNKAPRQKSRKSSGPPPRGLSYGPPPSELREPPPKRAASMSELIKDGVYMGRPFPELGEEGQLDEHPVALLLSTIRYDGSTGMLDMTDDGTHRRIYIIDGNPTFMQSNAEGENVGALLLRRGRITDPDFDRCLRYMKDKSKTLQQAVLQLRLVSEHDLATAYKLLAGQLLPLAIGMSTGTYRWRVTDAFVARVPEGKFEPVSVLFEGIKRHVHPPQILRFFRGQEDVPIVRTTEFDKLMPFFRRTFSATNIASQIDGANTYRTISRGSSGDAASVVPQLFALVTSGMAVLPELTSGIEMAVAVNVAVGEIANMEVSGDAPAAELHFEDDDDDVISDSDRKARAKVRRYHQEIMRQDFFQIFGASPDSDPDRIKSAYFELAKRWHTDAYANINLGAQTKQLGEVFQRITEAYETITDKNQREEYLVYIDRKAKGLPTDVSEILRAEQLFDQASAMVRRRDWNGARQVIEEAISLSPDPIYYATLGWVVFNTNKSSQVHVTEAVNYLKKAVKEQENLPIAYQYLGQICFVRQNFAEAKKWWHRCLEYEPNNIDAARGMRMINQRMEKSQSKGLLSKFLTKK